MNPLKKIAIQSNASLDRKSSIDEEPQPIYEEAQRGNVRAQWNLAVMYENEQNFVQSFKWYAEAAQQGHAEAQYVLGLMYEKGQGVKKDSSKAFEWYNKSAQQGCAWGQYYLSRVYDWGFFGVQQDPKLAFIWCEKAAQQGLAPAQANLAQMIYYHNRLSPSPSWEQDSEAFTWCEKAVLGGSVVAQHHLGIQYEHGHGVEQDLSRALECYEKGAASGDKDACRAIVNSNRKLIHFS